MALSIFESIGLPRAEPIDTTVWLAATAADTLTATDVTGQELSGSVLGIITGPADELPRLAPGAPGAGEPVSPAIGAFSCAEGGSDR